VSGGCRKSGTTGAGATRYGLAGAAPHLPFPATMSGPTVGRALCDRFESIRRHEIERLKKKLRGLSDDERRSLEAITCDIVRAIATVPQRALEDDTPQPALDALVRLFALDA
jgi:glutamyl-tRNA reductase